MNNGIGLNELAAKLTAQMQSAKDLIVPVEKLTATEKGIAIANGETKEFSVNNWSFGQLATFADVPKQYADKLRNENPSLMVQNLNHGLGKHKDESRMIRTYNGTARAFLSSRYQRYDAYPMMEKVILPFMIGNDLKPLSTQVTEKMIYVKAISEKLYVDIREGERLYLGFSWSTSEVGAGASVFDLFAYNTYCLNGTAFGVKGLRKVHLGRNLAGDDIMELISDSTRCLTEQAYHAQVNDVLARFADPEFFLEKVEAMKAATERQIENNNLPEVIELAMSTAGVSGKDDFKNNLLSQLASGKHGGLTQWSLANAFNRLAHEGDYERCHELEKAAGTIIELTDNQWNKIAA